MLGLRCWVGFSPAVERKGHCSVAMHRLLTVVASLVAEHEILGTVRQLEHTGNSILEKRESGREISRLERVHLMYPIE